jgi:glycerol-3-phosphate dehydrogenase
LPIVQSARSSPILRASLCPHTEHIVGEAVEAFQHEYAVKLADVLLRRVPVALGPCWLSQCSEIAAVKIASAMGWSSAEMNSQLESFQSERQAFVGNPADAKE